MAVQFLGDPLSEIVYTHTKSKLQLVIFLPT